MNNYFKFTFFILFIFCLFIASSNVGAIYPCDFPAGPDQAYSESRCLRQLQDDAQRVRDQQQADADYAQGLYEIQLKYFYELDASEKQWGETEIKLDAIVKFESPGYCFYSNSDCIYGREIPSDPTAIDPNRFLSLMENKKKCIAFLSQCVTSKINVANKQPTKTDDQICSDGLGQNWKWDGTKTDGKLNCGCKDGYAQKNGQCVTYDQSCNINYPNAIFLKIDAVDGRRVCDCKSGYVWNEQRTGCIIAPIVLVKTNDQICSDKYPNTFFLKINDVTGGRICDCKTGYVWNEQETGCIIASVIPVKTNDQICQDSYGLNSSWGGTKNDGGGLVCDCRAGYQWNEGQTQCIVIPKIETVIVPLISESVSEIKNTQNTVIPKAETVATPFIGKSSESVFTGIKGNTKNSYGGNLGGVLNDNNSELSAPIYLDNKVATGSTEVVKQKSFWTRIKGWFGFK